MNGKQLMEFKFRISSSSDFFKVCHRNCLPWPGDFLYGFKVEYDLLPYTNSPYGSWPWWVCHSQFVVAVGGWLGQFRLGLAHMAN